MSSKTTTIGMGSPSPSTPLSECSCHPCAIPQLLFNHRPGAVFAWALACPYCGKATTWRKTAMSAAKTWNDRHANALQTPAALSRRNVNGSVSKAPGRP